MMGGHKCKHNLAINGDKRDPAGITRRRLEGGEDEGGEDDLRCSQNFEQSLAEYLEEAKILLQASGGGNKVGGYCWGHES
jgi:hypothetical protein